MSVGSNTSTNLSAGQRNELPGQVSSFLLGLVAGGYEPVSMRYFTLDDSGEIHYVEQADIDAALRLSPGEAEFQALAAQIGKRGPLAEGKM